MSIIGAYAAVLHDVLELCSAASVPATILFENIDIIEKCNFQQIVNR